MAADVIKFVDSIASSPTTLLDVNADLNPWICRSITADPPRLRRAVSSNAMRDGVFVSSSQYDARTVVLELECLSNTQDLGATQLQTLARTLDRSDVFLMWQPNSLTKPVFFKLFRSDMSAIRDIQTSAKAYRAVTVELLAEPFALGLRETFGAFTLNNDPAAGSNGCYFDVTGVIGDVPAPAVLVNLDTSPTDAGMLAVRQHGTPSDFTTWQWVQAESLTPGTDTTNPGGGPDAAMSGAGTNNYLRTSFATNAAMNLRVSGPSVPITLAIGAAIRGRFNVVAVVRRSDATSVIRARHYNAVANAAGPTTIIPATTSRQAVNLGIIEFGGAANQLGLESALAVKDTYQIYAERVSGAGTIDWDGFFLLPADEATLTWSTADTTSPGIFVIDGVNQALVLAADSPADPMLGSAYVNKSCAWSASGGFMSLVPNQTNRMFWLVLDKSGSALLMDKAETTTVKVYYYPRYLHVRPSAT